MFQVVLWVCLFIPVMHKKTPLLVPYFSDEENELHLTHTRSTQASDGQRSVWIQRAKLFWGLW